MLWNFMMHGLMGWLGAYYFMPTMEGIGVAVLATCMTQAADQVRLRKEMWLRVESLPSSEQREARAELESSIGSTLRGKFIQNVIIFSAEIMLVAHAARLNGWI
ncbi:MAG: hypothetical protein HOM84_06210 [Thiotrichales bacterium]|mgnify:FL=1|jgi:hypothetical protein|nr:hypothetical protein [Thiotrichales bacterium]MBT3613882.1 hypothetical protein [Thiotrichales bacterium]MBT3752958.1 hypothetical protein [Thiotrichales bacterium]MBT3838176.1 hypothetical protein [Thiotrichales bacterium]MBT4151814.1 hypothetical protein [Thiotrichales bacterium]